MIRFCHCFCPYPRKEIWSEPSERKQTLPGNENTFKESAILRSRSEKQVAIQFSCDKMPKKAKKAKGGKGKKGGYV